MRSIRRFGALIAPLLLGVGLWPLAVAAGAYSGLVVEVDTDRVLYERNADDLRHPASITKMMTLYLVFEALANGEISLRTPLKVSRFAVTRPPSKLGLSAGDTIAVEDAILALVTRSANDAATVIAENLGGSEPAFAQMMTQKARELGMRRSVFRNASGLPDPEQVTTAWDMYRLGKALLQDFPEYYRYFSTQTFYYRGRGYGNHNHLMETYPGMDGIKTGFINASGFNLVASAKRGGRRLIGVVFGGPSAVRRDAHMREILDDGFAQLLDGAPPRIFTAEFDRTGSLLTAGRSRSAENRIFEYSESDYGVDSGVVGRPLRSGGRVVRTAMVPDESEVFVRSVSKRAPLAEETVVELDEPVSPEAMERAHPRIVPIDEDDGRTTGASGTGASAPGVRTEFQEPEVLSERSARAGSTVRYDAAAAGSQGPAVADGSDRGPPRQGMARLPQADALAQRPSAAAASDRAVSPTGGDSGDARVEPRSGAGREPEPMVVTDFKEPPRLSGDSEVLVEEVDETQVPLPSPARPTAKLVQAVPFPSGRTRTELYAKATATRLKVKEPPPKPEPVVKTAARDVRPAPALAPPKPGKLRVAAITTRPQRAVAEPKALARSHPPAEKPGKAERSRVAPEAVPRKSASAPAVPRKAALVACTAKKSAKCGTKG